MAVGGVTARERYVEDFGLLLGEYGTARTLRASRGSISSATRSLVQMGLVERMTKPGERRGLEEMRSSYAFWDSELPAALARWEKKAKGGR
ncbi:MAG TPA: hypothetical protein VK869_07015 [Rubrobacteraceae bacterium]|nr:hypothetical protein [Rubrobacteraceae bacterium]